jgi:hypothetical protein
MNREDMGYLTQEERKRSCEIWGRWKGEEKPPQSLTKYSHKGHKIV